MSPLLALLLLFNTCKATLEDVDVCRKPSEGLTFRDQCFFKIPNDEVPKAPNHDHPITKTEAAVICGRHNATLPLLKDKEITEWFAREMTDLNMPLAIPLGLEVIESDSQTEVVDVLWDDNERDIRLIDAAAIHGTNYTFDMKISSRKAIIYFHTNNLQWSESIGGNTVALMCQKHLHETDSSAKAISSLYVLALAMLMTVGW